MLVNKLEEIGAAVTEAAGPRYFILYMRSGRAELERFAMLKDITKWFEGHKGRRAITLSKI